MSRRLATLAGSAVLLAALFARAQEPASALNGHWTLNRELSQDMEAKIKDAAGSQYMTGSGPGWAPPETWLPIGVKFDEHERLEVRRFLLATIPVFSDLHFDLTPAEIKTTHGEAGVRIFNLSRATAGTSTLTGEKVTRQARWEGQKLILDSKGKDSRMVESITVSTEEKRITYALHFEAKILEKTLDLNLVYDRAPR
jgi:hypothetical protein